MAQRPGLPIDRDVHPAPGDLGSCDNADSNRVDCYAGSCHTQSHGDTLTGAGRSLSWEAENRPISITLGGITTTFGYDGDGKRVMKAESNGSVVTTTHYIGNYFEQVLVNDVVTETVKYYYASGKRIAMSRNGTLSYIFTDHLGGTSVVLNPSNGITNTIAYYPFGASRFSTGDLQTDRLFTGQRLDETGLYDFGARMYDVMGRFISPDSIVPEPGKPQDLNRYSYGRNNPLKYVDPSDHASIIGEDESGNFLYGEDPDDPYATRGPDSPAPFNSNPAEPVVYGPPAPQYIEGRYTAMPVKSGMNTIYTYQPTADPPDSANLPAGSAKTAGSAIELINSFGAHTGLWEISGGVLETKSGYVFKIYVDTMRQSQSDLTYAPVAQLSWASGENRAIDLERQYVYRPQPSWIEDILLPPLPSALYGADVPVPYNLGKPESLQVDLGQRIGRYDVSRLGMAGGRSVIYKYPFGR